MDLCSPGCRAAAPLLLSALLASGCGICEVHAQRRSTREFPRNTAARVIVDTFNGDVRADAPAGDTVRVEIELDAAGLDDAAAQRRLDDIVVDITHEGDALHVSAHPRNDGDDSCLGASFTVHLPADMPVELATSNGSVAAADVTSVASARTTNGSVDVRGVTGSVHATSSNGDVAVAGQGVVLDAQTTNGAVRFAGTLAAGAHRLRTTNGDVALTLPSDARFQLDAQTQNGEVTSPFVPEASEGANQTHVVANVGNAGANAAVVTLRTTNGSIRVDRAM